MKHFTIMAGALAGLLLAGTGAAVADGKGNDNHGKSGHSQGGNCSGKKNHGCESHGKPSKSHKSDEKYWSGQSRATDPSHWQGKDSQAEDWAHKPFLFDQNHWAHHSDDDVYYHPYNVGHALPEGYVVMFDPSRYPSWPNSQYVRYGSFLYLIDRLTGSILQPPDPVQDWNWDWHDANYANCPPGLAKKNPPCIPPGQVRNGVGIDPYHVGDRLPSGYDVILNPPSLTEPDRSVYARSGDMLYRVAPDTGIVEQQIGEVGKLIR